MIRTMSVLLEGTVDIISRRTSDVAYPLLLPFLRLRLLHDAEVELPALQIHANHLHRHAVPQPIPPPRTPARQAVRLFLEVAGTSLPLRHVNQTRDSKR